MILQRLSHVIQKAGGSVRIEPNWFDGKRPDAHVYFAQDNVMIDVSVIHPAAPSYARSGAASYLGACRLREKHKEAKYRDVTREEEARFVPFVMETFGAMGTQASSFLKELGCAPVEQTQNMDFKNYMTRVLSITPGRQRFCPLERVLAST